VAETVGGFGKGIVAWITKRLDTPFRLGAASGVFTERAEDLEAPEGVDELDKEMNGELKRKMDVELVGEEEDGEEIKRVRVAGL